MLDWGGGQASGALVMAGSVYILLTYLSTSDRFVHREDHRHLSKHCAEKC